MYYSDEIFYRILWKNPLKPIVEEYVKLQSYGKLWYGICPFHKEETSSFSIDNNKNTFFCFGCGESGNVVDFVMKVKSCSFIEAMEFLATRSGMQLPAPRIENNDEKILQANDVAMRYYQNNLYGRNEEMTPGMKYFSGRGLSEKTIQDFHLGYVGDYSQLLYRRLLSYGFTEEEAVRSKLVDKCAKTGKFRDCFWNRVMFPIFNENGQTIGFGGRIMGEGKPKYLNSPETSVFDKGSNLYAINIAKYNADKGIILAEGYMDVISLHQAGFNNAVASLGTALTASQAALIKKYTDTVYIAYDGDEPGVMAALKAIPILLSVGIKARIIKMPGAKDPDEFLVRFGKKAFIDQIKLAEKADRFIVQNSSSINSAIDILLKKI